MPRARLFVFAIAALALAAGCTPDVPEEARDTAPAGEEGWRVHVAGPEAGEDHPGSVLLTRRSEDEGAAGARPRLVLGCEEGVTQAYVEWAVPLGAGALPVTYRLDEADARADRWPVSADGEAAGLWGDSTSVPFIRALLGRDHLVMEVTPADGRLIASRFTLGGLDSLVAAVQERCGWRE